MNNPQNIGLIGIGGCGNNLLNAVMTAYPHMTSTMAINTDKKTLSQSTASASVWFSSPNSPRLIFQEIQSYRHVLMQFMTGAQGVILLAGLGGFAGSFATPEIAALAQSVNRPALAIVIEPFQFEGQERIDRSKEAQEKLIEMNATIASFDNQYALTRPSSTETSMADAFEFVEKEVVKFLELYLVDGVPLSHDNSLQV